MKTIYKNINKFIWHHPFIKSTLHFLSRFIPPIIIIFYALFVLKIYLVSFNNFYSTLYKPLVTLIIVTILRILINRTRPAVKYGFTPIDESNASGRSFPSFHVALAVSIALTVIQRGPNMGLFLSVLAAITTFVRTFTGVHYFSDILGSVLIAYLVNLFF